MSGDLVDDDRRAREDDGQADGRLDGVAHVPEQERRRHSDGEEALHEREQVPVDERDPRRQHPVRSRAGEGGKRRRAQSESTNAAAAAIANHIGEVGAPGSSRLTASSSKPTLRQEHDPPLEPVLARELSDPAHAVKVLQAPACRLLPGRRPHRRRVGARIIGGSEHGSGFLTRYHAAAA